MDKLKFGVPADLAVQAANHLSDGRYDQEVLLSSMRSRAVLHKAPPPMRAVLPAPPPATPPACSVSVSVD